MRISWAILGLMVDRGHRRRFAFERLVVLAIGLGCSDDAVPAPTLECGAADVEIQAAWHLGCAPDQQHSQRLRDHIDLDAHRGAWEDERAVGQNAATLALTCVRRVAGDAAVLELTAAARASRVCGVHCGGGGAHAAMIWTGRYTLPATSPQYRLRVVVTASRRAADRPIAHEGHCQVELLARPPILVRGSGFERDFVVPAGTGEVRLNCHREPGVGLAFTACFGAVPGEPTAPAWIEADVALRLEATPLRDGGQ